MNNVMLVDDHASFRGAMAFLIDREPGLRVVAQAGTLFEARQLLTSDIDVAVVDLGLPDGSGIEFIKDLQGLSPEAVVLVLSASIDPEAETSAIKAGAAGVLHKAASIVEIAEAVKAAANGEGRPLAR